MSRRELPERADGERRDGGAGGEGCPVRADMGGGDASALRFIVLLGVVSLFADVTYEGARGVAGPFLGTLGAGGAVVATVAGLGELVGYAIRLASGYLTDRTGRPWFITGLGYAVNLLSVPLLALAWRWEVAAGLLVAERFGKAVRSPARNAMLSHAAARVGFGWGFGLHKALDQLGAVAGPLLVSLVLASGLGYRAAFAALLLPAAAALAVLLTARALYPAPRDLEEAGDDGGGGAGSLPGSFWLLTGGAALLGAGVADYPLLAYHLAREAVPAPVIPLLYALAMAASAAAALVLGKLYDRTDRAGRVVLAVGVGLSSLAAPPVLLGGYAGAVPGTVLWGIGAGVHESVLLAAVAGLVPRHRRGAAYGAFNAVFGAGWFLGSAGLGFLYDRSPALAAAASLVLQAASIPALWTAAPGAASRGAR